MKTCQDCGREISPGAHICKICHLTRVIKRRKERLAARERMKAHAKAAGCPHHWRIETPNGPESRGVCQLCGAVKQFPNDLQAVLVGPVEPRGGVPIEDQTELIFARRFRQS